MFFASQPGEIIVDTGDIIIRFPLERPAQVMNPVFVLIRKSKVEKDRPGPLPVATSTDPAENFIGCFFVWTRLSGRRSEGIFFRRERWLRSFGQYFLFLRWNLCLVLGCLFDRRQHHGIRFVRGPFL